MQTTNQHPQSRNVSPIADIELTVTKDERSDHCSVQANAKDVFDSAQTCSSHAYLISKGVNGKDLREMNGNLLIPILDSNMALSHLQVMTTDGQMNFLPDEKVDGCFHAIDGDPGVLLICDSYETGASLHEATGYAVAVALSADNIGNVARNFRSRHPDVKIVIASNNDSLTEGNDSFTKTKAIAEAVNAGVAIPDFGDKQQPGDAKSFNDLHQHLGLASVKDCVDAAIANLPNAEIYTATSFEPVEAADNHRNVPRPDPACLYGLVGDIAYAGSNHTEANTYAVAAFALVYLSAALGRRAYLPIGDDYNHPRLFFIHVGRSGRGRKGTAKKLILKIDEDLRSRYPDLTPQLHSGGLSTREGLAKLIHDGYKDGKIHVPAVDDKRLLVLESELANVLHQNKRDGNTLSTALRDAWDGTSLKPAVKNNPITTTEPHISFMGDITPSELLELMLKREMSNGFANRFIFFWAEGEKVIALPEPTPSNVVESLTNRVALVLQFAGVDQHGKNNQICMDWSPDAKALYEYLYLGELQDRSAGERVSGLLDRRAPMLLRLAMVFALTDQTTTIASQHIKAAHAWVQYWTDSVKFIFQSADDEAKTALTSDVANKIKIYLRDNGPTTRTDISQKCLAGHVSKSIIDAALDELLTTAPPTIEVVTVPRTKGQAGSSTKLYKLFKETISANCAKSAKFQINHKTEVTTDRGPVNQVDISLSSHTSQPYAEKSIT